ncbi:ferrochelatase [Gordonia sinesedis]
MTGSDPDSGAPFDAVLFLSFGGPDGPDDVLPFLENVTAGRGVPRERLDEVAQHYLHFGGVSPINRLNLAMIDALRAELDSRALDLPVYFGNRNWHPLVEDTLGRMYADGHRRILAFPTSAWGGYSGCRQYHEDIARALAAVGRWYPDSVDADPILVRKLPQYWDHPGVVAAGADAVRRAIRRLTADDDPGTGTASGAGRAGAGPPRLVFTAHSVPVAADQRSGPPDDGGRLYSRQVAAASAAVAEAAGVDRYDQVWQSRSGPPQVPWLEPDICDHLETLAAQGIDSVVVYPIGFVSDHLEVVWDLDHEAAETAERLGMRYVRADTVGTDPQFITMIADLVQRYAGGGGDRAVIGCGDNGSPCRQRCCEPAARPAGPTTR